MKIKKNLFSMMLKGQRSLIEKYEETFNRIFEELKVIEKSKNFKESELDKFYRELRKKMRY